MRHYLSMGLGVLQVDTLRRIELQRADVMQRQTARPDTDFRGRELVSGDKAFPHSLLSLDQTTGRATQNQLSQFATNSMISEKRRQCNTRYKFVVKKLEQLRQKTEAVEHSEEEDIDRAWETLQPVQQAMQMVQQPVPVQQSQSTTMQQMRSNSEANLGPFTVKIVC